MKAKKNNKIKRIVAIYLTVVFVLTAVAVFGVSATTNTWVRTVELASIEGDRHSDGVTLHGRGRMSDIFPSYPRIYDGYSTSVNKARAYGPGTRDLNDWQQFTLYANGGGVVNVNYGSNLDPGQYVLQYEHVSQGGFRANVTWSETY